MNLEKNLKETKQKDSLINALSKARKNTISDFGGIEHRLELVDTINGVQYVNDSKATDVSSTYYSLEYMNESVVWILSESDMETDYSLFLNLVQEKVSAIIFLGSHKNGVLNRLIDEVDCFAETPTLEEAVQISFSLSAKGDVVLFSPACSSFHLFQDYKDRGNQFKKAVANLK